jgi:DNA-binding SARP family transcriptional activator
VAIGVLGGFSVRRGAWSVEESAWDRKVAQRLLRLLLVRRGDPVPEDDLLDALWSGKPADSARRGLQTAVSAIRGVLDVPGAPTRIEVSERTYALRLRDGDTVDADAFEAAAELALATDGLDRLPALRAAAERWTGEPLPEERYSDWAASWRERLTDRYADVLAALADAHEAAGDRAAGARVARALVDLDPLDENAHRLLMRSYARAGRRGHALRQFLECRRVLVDELGVEPSAETVAYQRRILDGEAL